MVISQCFDCFAVQEAEQNPYVICDTCAAKEKGPMVIYIYSNGEWDYEWEMDYSGLNPNEYDKHTVRVDLDRLYAYKDLTLLQIKACEEALSE